MPARLGAGRFTRAGLLLAGAPEETRTQVLGLLARLIARGGLAEDLAAEAGER